jgi:hypothetical protein
MVANEGFGWRLFTSSERKRFSLEMDRDCDGTVMRSRIGLQRSGVQKACIQGRGRSDGDAETLLIRRRGNAYSREP